jgi:DNA-binding PadR family transcriptional regulator
VSKSLSSWWPRTERQLYEQPKILVEHGLATATTELVGRRPRTVYGITSVGREALRAWLDEPSTVYAWEWDAVLRVFFADQGSKEQLLTTLRETAATLRAVNAADLDGLVEVSQPGYRYADRAHLFALIVKLEENVCAAIDEWFEWAEQEVAGWPDITGPPDRIAYFQQVLGEVTPDYANPRCLPPLSSKLPRATSTASSRGTRRSPAFESTRSVASSRRSDDGSGD